jgi:hypothetical protein
VPSTYSVRLVDVDSYAERFVRSIPEDCLDRLILFGERRLLRALDEFVAPTIGSETIRGSATSCSRPSPAPSGPPRSLP